MLIGYTQAHVIVTLGAHQTRGVHCGVTLRHLRESFLQQNFIGTHSRGSKYRKYYHVAPCDGSPGKNSFDLEAFKCTFVLFAR